MTVSKGLSREQVLRTAQNHLTEMGKCNAGMKISGQAVVLLTINPDGTVKSAKLETRYVKNKTLRQCILDQVKGWLFDAAADGKESQATVVFKIG